MRSCVATTLQSENASQRSTNVVMTATRFILASLGARVPPDAGGRCRAPPAASRPSRPRRNPVFLDQRRVRAKSLAHPHRAAPQRQAVVRLVEEQRAQVIGALILQFAFRLNLFVDIHYVAEQYAALARVNHVRRDARS